MRRVELAGLVFDDLRDHRLPQPEGVRDLPAKALHGLKAFPCRWTAWCCGTGPSAMPRCIRTPLSRAASPSPTWACARRTSRTHGRQGDLTAVFTGLVQRHVPLRAEVRVPLDGDRGDFDYRLQVGDLDMTTLAEFIEPVLFLRVREGDWTRCGWSVPARRRGPGPVVHVPRGPAGGAVEQTHGGLHRLRQPRGQPGGQCAGAQEQAQQGLERPTPLYFERLKDRGFVNPDQAVPEGCRAPSGWAKGEPRGEAHRRGAPETPGGTAGA